MHNKEVLSAKVEKAVALTKKLLDLHNSSDHTQARYNNCFVIHSKHFIV